MQLTSQLLAEASPEMRPSLWAGWGEGKAKRTLSLPLSLPFPRYFSPNREPVHRLMRPRNFYNFETSVTLQLLLLDFQSLLVMKILWWSDKDKIT